MDRIFLIALCGFSCLIGHTAAVSCFGTTADNMLAYTESNDISCTQSGLTNAFGTAIACDNSTSRYDTSSSSSCSSSTCLTVAFVMDGFTGVYYGAACASGGTISAQVCIPGTPSTTITTTTAAAAAAVTTAAGSDTTAAAGATNAATDAATTAAAANAASTAAAGSATTAAAAANAETTTGSGGSAETSTASGPSRRRKRQLALSVQEARRLRWEEEAAVEHMRVRRSTGSSVTCATVTLPAPLSNCTLVGEAGYQTTTAATYPNGTGLGFDVTVGAFPAECCTTEKCNNVSSGNSVQTQYTCSAGSTDNTTSDANSLTCPSCWGMVKVTNGTTEVIRGCQKVLEYSVHYGSNLGSLSCDVAPECRYINDDTTTEECFLCCTGNDCNSGYTEAVIRAGRSSGAAAVFAQLTLLFFTSLLAFLL